MYFTIKSFYDLVILTDEVMEDISRIWSTLDDNVPATVTISGYISQIFVYPASYQTYQFWKRKLNSLKPGSVLVCQDCVLLDPLGNQMRLVDHYSSIHRDPLKTRGQLCGGHICDEEHSL